MPKPIKLSGREATVIRAIGFATGMKGGEIRERTRMPDDELVDVLNGLMSIGYIETASMREVVAVGDYEAENFEVNPSYAGDLKPLVRR